MICCWMLLGLFPTQLYLFPEIRATWLTGAPTRPFKEPGTGHYWLRLPPAPEFVTSFVKAASDIKQTIDC